QDVGENSSVKNLTHDNRRSNKNFYLGMNDNNRISERQKWLVKESTPARFLTPELLRLRPGGFDHHAVVIQKHHIPEITLIHDGGHGNSMRLKPFLKCQSGGLIWQRD